MDSDESITMKLDGYEQMIMHRAIRLYVVVAKVDLADLDPRDPDAAGIEEMISRAGDLLARLERDGVVIG